MNEIVKNEYAEIQKYFDDYYKEQLKKYEELKYYDNYLFTEVKYEPHCWILGLAFLGLANLLADITHKELWDYVFFSILGILILLLILIFFKSIFWNFDFER